MRTHDHADGSVTRSRSTRYTALVFWIKHFIGQQFKCIITMLSIFKKDITAVKYTLIDANITLL